MQYDLNLRDYLRISQKRRWILISMPLLAGALGWLLTESLPELYQARGAIRVIKRSFSAADAMMDAFYYMEQGNYLDTHAQVMTSREVLKEVAVKLWKGQLDGDISDEELANSTLWLGALDQLRNSLLAEPIAGTSIIQVTATHSKPDLAMRWVNTLLDTYEQRHYNEVNRQVIRSTEYIDEQLQRFEKSLREAEDTLTEFKLNNAESISLRTDEVSLTQEQLENTEVQLAQLNLQIDVLEEALESGSLPSLDLLARISADDLRIQRRLAGLSDLEERRQVLLSYQTSLSPEVGELDEQIRATLSVLHAELVASRDRFESERRRLEQKFLVLPANDVTLARLERTVQVNQDTYSLLLEEQQRARLRQAEDVKEVTIIERAVTADSIPQTGRAGKAFVAMLIGLLLGVVFALVVESLDTSIGAIEDVESLLDLPVIGIVPPFDFDNVKGVIRAAAPQMVEHADVDYLVRLVAHYDPRSPVAEAYRAIRTNIDQTREQVDGRIVIVTSSVLEEGKTTTIANLALTFAQMGRKTLIVAADLRRPDIHRIFGLQKEPGLADVLTGSMPWESVTRSLSDVLLGELSMDVVMLTPGMDNLHVIPSGANPLNPAELLSSNATHELMQKLREAFDVVFIDTPPIIPVTDAAILAEHADGIIIVYEVGKVGRDVLKRAKSHMDSVQANIWGIVMNDVKAEAQTTLRDTDYYYYHYRYEESRRRQGAGVGARLGKTAARLLGSRR